MKEENKDSNDSKRFNNTKKKIKHFKRRSQSQSQIPHLNYSHNKIKINEPKNNREGERSA